MKTILGLGCVLCLGLILGFGFLGCAWVIEGHGLHPVLAITGAVFSLGLGYAQACIIETLE